MYISTPLNWIERHKSKVFPDNLSEVLYSAGILPRTGILETTLVTKTLYWSFYRAGERAMKTKVELNTRRHTI